MLPPRKMTIAVRMTGLRPKTSEILPQKGTEAALAKRYADPVQAYNESEMWNESEMAGRAVGMSTVSRATNNIARFSAIKASSVGRSGRCLCGGTLSDGGAVLVPSTLPLQDESPRSRAGSSIGATVDQVEEGLTENEAEARGMLCADAENEVSPPIEAACVRIEADSGSVVKARKLFLYESVATIAI